MAARARSLREPFGDDARRASASSATTISMSRPWPPAQLSRQLARAVHRRLDRVEESGADAGLLELADGGDRRSARRGHRLAQLDGVHALVAQLLRGAEHRLHDERRRDLARDAEQDARLDHRLGEQREVRQARSRRARSRRPSTTRARARRGRDAAEPPLRARAARRLRARPRRFPPCPRARSTASSASRARPGCRRRCAPRCSAVRIAAATERSVWSCVSSGPISASRASMSCGFTATTTSCAPSRRRRRSTVVASTP